MASSTTRRRVGATVELDGEKEYKQAVASLNQANKVLASEMTKLKAEYKGQADSTEFLTKKGVLLEQQLQQQHEKVKYLKDQLEKATSAEKQNAEWVNKLKIALNNAEAAEFNLQHSIEENNQALENQGNVMNKVAGSVQGIADKFGIQLPAGADKALNAMKGFSNGSVAAMAAVGAAVAAVIEGVKALTQMTLDVAADVDTIITESIVNGIDTRTYQALQYAENLVDVSVSTMSSSLTKLMQNMRSARDGNEELASSFQSLGIQIQNEDGTLRDSYDVMMELVDVLGMMEAGTERDAVTTALLGKSAQELNPLIEAGSKALQEYGEQAEAVGYILDEDQIKKLGEVDDAYQEVQLTVEALKKQMAAEFAPAAKEAMELFADVVQKAGKALVDSGIIDGIGEVIISLSMTAKQVLELLGLTDTIPEKLSPVADALYEVADLIARINDGFSFFSGLFKTGSIFKMKEGFEQMKNALGFGYGSGNPNNHQKMRMIHEGTWDQYSDFYGIGHNATGTEDWRGGLTWVGETGPELVDVPQGSRIYSATESAAMMGDVVVNQVFHINVDDLQDLQKLISWGKTAAANARVANRMGSGGYVSYPSLA